MTTPDIAQRLARLSTSQRQELERLLDQRRRTAAPDQPARPTTATEDTLAGIWSELLGVPHPGVHDNFYALGGDSIIGMQIAARATAQGIRVSPQQVLEAGTIARLAELSAERKDAPGESDQPLGEVRLTPIQRWFFEQEIPESHHWDQTLYIALRRPVRAAALRRALTEVAAHHDVLRSRFLHADDGWHHWVDAQAPAPVLSEVALDGLSGPDRTARIRTAVQEAQRGIDVEHGPLLGAVLCQDGGGGESCLVLIAHHLVVDGLSLRVLTDDLDQVYRQLERAEQPRLSARTTSFRRWSELLHQWAREPRITEQLPYWRQVPRETATRMPLGGPYEDGPDGGQREPGEQGPPPGDQRGPERRNTVGRSATHAARLPQHTTERLLRDVPASGVQPHHLLLAALLLAWPRSADADGAQLDLEAHGREVIAGDANVARTVGWFTSIYPVRFPFPPQSRPRDAVTAVVRTLEEVPDNGVGYGLLRYLRGPEGAELAALPQSRVSFNYLGRFERGGGAEEVFGNPVQAPGVLQSDQAPRRYLLDVVVTAVERELTVEFVYAQDYMTAAEIQPLADRYVKHLTELTNSFAERSEGAVDDRQLDAIKRQMGLGRAHRP